MLPNHARQTADVAEALQQTQAHHRTYQRAIRDGDEVAAITALRAAQASRMRAADLDPDRTALAWHEGAGQWPHDDLLAFYQQELTTLTRHLAAPLPRHGAR